MLRSMETLENNHIVYECAGVAILGSTMNDGMLHPDISGRLVRAYSRFVDHAKIRPDAVRGLFALAMVDAYPEFTDFLTESSHVN